MTVHAQAPRMLVAVDDLLDEALLRSLEPTIAVLDRMLDDGPAVADPDGAPDGFDGLDRVGSLEHLLATEWLLVGEEPDEFVRRFSERELGYLRRAHVREHRARTSLVLFDAGPGQLGAPRLAHLACFVALARRCHAAGTPLRWGTLQSPDRFELRGAGDLHRFLRTRTTQPPPADAPLDALVDDCLVVAPHGLAASRQLVLVDEGEDVLATLIDHRAGTRRTVHVPLPGRTDAVRLLRNPAGPREVGHDSGGGDGRPTSNLVFDHSGNKVIARSGDGSAITVFPAPNSPNLPDPRARILPGITHLGPVSAAGRIGRGVITATIGADGDDLFIFVKGSTKGRAVPRGRLPLSEPLRPTTVDDPLGQIRWFGTTLHVQIGDHLAVLDDERFIVRSAPPGWRWGTAPYDLVATSTEDGLLVRDGGTETLHVLPDGSRAFGVARLPDLGAAVLRIDDGHRIVAAVVDLGAVRELCVADAEIVDAVAHHDRALLAYRTARGDVEVRSNITGARHYRWRPG